MNNRKRIPEIVVYKVLIRDKLACAYCGFKGDSFEKWFQLSIDHIIPEQCGGSSNEDNLITCCLSCNSVTSGYRPEGACIAAPTRSHILVKRELVAAHRKAALDTWLSQVREACIEQKA